MKSYLIFGQDNGKYAYEKNESVSCEECGIINREESNTKPFEKLKYDISSTYDNEMLISHKIYERFCKFVDASNFHQAGNYYYIFPKNKIEIDSLKRKIRFGDNCSKCNTPSHVIGITPCYLSQEVAVSGIYATHLNFGDKDDFGSNLTPGIIVTEDIINDMLQLKPTGLNYEATHC